MKILTRLLLAVALLAGLAACSDGGGDETVPDISDQALTLDDLPEGWAEDNSDDDDDDASFDCLESVDDDESNVGLTGRAEVSYTGGSSGIPALHQLLAEYEDVDAATEVTDTLDGILDACGAFEEESDGATLVGQIGKVSFPDVAGADQQISYQMTAEADGISASAAMIGLRKGTFVTFLLWIDLGSYDADQVAEVATTALAKLG